MEIKTPEFPDIIEEISMLNWKFLTVKRLRKRLGIPSDNSRLIRKISNTLVWLEHFGFLEVVQKRSPKRYRITPDFFERTRDIVRMYRK
ncbi:MAG: hypothetical protein ACTSQI_16625 [Candidatus Helarchaeota archaeon]